MAIQHRTSKAPKTKISFLCGDCGHSSPKWEGRCAACGAWGTYVEFAEPGRPARAVGPRSQALAPEPAPIGEQSAPDGQRLSLGMPEIDRLLGELLEFQRGLRRLREESAAEAAGRAQEGNFCTIVERGIHARGQQALTWLESQRRQERPHRRIKTDTKGQEAPAPS